MAEWSGEELPYGEHWSALVSIDVVEIIHGQYLKGLLLSQNRKKYTIEEVFYWEIQIIVICKQILILESYTESQALR